jgi:hypothetical protein
MSLPGIGERFMSHTEVDAGSWWRNDEEESLDIVIAGASVQGPR